MIHAKMRLEKLNEEFKGRKIKHCNELGHSLNFDYHILGFCCSSTTGNSPIVCNTSELNESEFNKEVYVNRLIDIILANQTNGPCSGCKNLEEVVFEGIEYDDVILDSIVWNHFRGCNSNCIYCDQNETKCTESYLAYKVAEELYKQGFLRKNTSISFGGGEPSIMEHLKEHLQFAYRHQYKQLLNTSGILFSNEIYDGLSKGLKVQISVDSGTRETYQKIKLRDQFQNVWEHIGKYCNLSEQVYVKYIVFSWNSSKKDLDGFIDQCIKNRVQNVVISGEANAIFKRTDRWNFGKLEEEACAYLIDKCLEHNIATYFSSGNFSEEIENRILQKLSNRLKSRLHVIHDLYIFGMGSNGRRLYDSLFENGIQISGFLDNDMTKQTESYNGVQCYAPKEVRRDVHIMISNSDHIMIQKQLQMEGFENISAFHI